MRIGGVGIAVTNPYVGKLKSRSSVDEYTQLEKQAETVGFISVLDSEINKLNKQKSSIITKKQIKVERI